MFKTIKIVAIIFAATLFTTTSCMNDVEDQPSRTPEMEQAELDQVLANLETGGYDIDTTDLGVYYITHKEGEGSFPETGDTCNIIYAGYLLDGSIFDASHFHYQDSIWQLIYKEVALIPGFDDGIALMNKGAEVDMIIPSELAYGPLGSGNIPPYTTLMFSAIMRDLKPVIEE